MWYKERMSLKKPLASTFHTTCVQVPNHSKICWKCLEIISKSFNISSTHTGLLSCAFIKYQFWYNFFCVARIWFMPNARRIWFFAMCFEPSSSYFRRLFCRFSSIFSKLFWSITAFSPWIESYTREQLSNLRLKLSGGDVWKVDFILKFGFAGISNIICCFRVKKLTTL